MKVGQHSIVGWTLIEIIMHKQINQSDHRFYWIQNGGNARAVQIEAKRGWGYLKSLRSSTHNSWRRVWHVPRWFLQAIHLHTKNYSNNKSISIYSLFVSLLAYLAEVWRERMKKRFNEVWLLLHKYEQTKFGSVCRASMPGFLTRYGIGVNLWSDFQAREVSMRPILISTRRKENTKCNLFLHTSYWIVVFHASTAQIWLIRKEKRKKTTG